MAPSHSCLRGSLWGEYTYMPQTYSDDGESSYGDNYGLSNRQSSSDVRMPMRSANQRLVGTDAAQLYKPAELVRREGSDYAVSQLAQGHMGSQFSDAVEHYPPQDDSSLEPMILDNQSFQGPLTLNSGDAYVPWLGRTPATPPPHQYADADPHEPQSVQRNEAPSLLTPDWSRTNSTRPLDHRFYAATAIEGMLGPQDHFDQLTTSSVTATENETQSIQTAPPKARRSQGSFKCPRPLCKIGLASSDGLRRHLRNHDSDPSLTRIHPCSKCGRKFSQQKDKRRHEKSHDEPSLRCNYLGCDMKFKGRPDNARRHVKNQHGVADNEAGLFVQRIE